MMKKIMLKSLIGFMMIGAFAIFSFAQTRERIQLKVDSSGNDTALQRTLAPKGTLIVTFRAIAGQTISYTAGYDFKDSDLRVSLWESGGNDSYKESGPKENNEFLIPKTGDYDILIENQTNKRVTTTLYMNLFSAEFMAEANSDIQTEALDFTGSDQANVSKTIPANGTMMFTFNGQKGATAIVNVTEKTNKLTVIFNENPNDKADTEIALNKDVSRKLTRTGKYTIEVVNYTAKAINFYLEVSFGISASTPQTITEEVQFAAGKTDAFLKRTLDANGSIEFTFHAKKGQRLSYSINYNVNKGLNSQDLEVEFIDPDSQDFRASGYADEPNEERIKTSGFHTVKVTNKTGKKVTFEFGISID